MKHLKPLGLAVLAAVAFACLGAGSASATTLEVGGITKNQPIALTMSLESGSSLTMSMTSGAFQWTCTQSHVAGATSSPYTGATVGAPVTAMAFTACVTPTTVHKAGTLSVEHIAGTTNSTVRSAGTELTLFSNEFGVYLNCKTGAGTHLGTPTGASSATGYATLHVDAVTNCGFFVPSSRWRGSYTITSPTGLGMSA